MFQQRYREAVDATKRAVEMSAQETPGDYMPFGNLGDARQLAGEPTEQARQAWRQAIGILEIRLRQAKDDPELLATRGMYRAKTGERADAAADAERATLLAPENATVHYLAALAFAVNGSNPQALEEIGAAVRLGYSTAEIRRAPEFKGLHGNPAFEQVLNKPAPR